MSETNGFQWIDGDKPAKGIYFNQGGVGIAIVAVEGQIGDWACYVGALTGNPDHSEVEAYRNAKYHGIKAPTPLAQQFFPDITNWRR